MRLDIVIQFVTAYFTKETHMTHLGKEKRNICARSTGDMIS